MNISRQQFRDAMVVVEQYCSQIRVATNSQPNLIGCRVKLSSWGITMQGHKNKNKSGIVVDYLPGPLNLSNDGTITVKWEGVRKPDSMHISQVEVDTRALKK